MLSTACPPLDALLDGGLEEDAITLVFGEGGSGKTNLALQCARQVVAAGGKVAYIDTEGVSGRRMEQVFEVAFPDAQERTAAEERVLFFSPFTIAEQEKMVERTAPLQGLGLIVVDSINMHYRLHIDDEKEAGRSKEKEASRSLYKQLHHLTGYARQHHVPVLVTGQVYGGEDATQPFARRVMEHLVKALVRFEKRPDGTRRATVLKHRSIEDGRQTRFRIGAHGLEALDAAQGAGNVDARGADSGSHDRRGGRRKGSDGQPLPGDPPHGHHAAKHSPGGPQRPEGSLPDRGAGPGPPVDMSPGAGAAKGAPHAPGPETTLRDPRGKGQPP